ncbi:hypothetical protein [Roseobacter cerasinus]|nr:hypothetical protein [Roseobacter cerasinus]
MSLDIFQKRAMALRLIFIAFIAGVVLALTVLVTKEMFILLFGLVGAAGGYLLHNSREHPNPLLAQRSLFNMRRQRALALGSLLAAAMAAVLFWEGVLLSQHFPAAAFMFTCGAYAFFAFSLSSYVFGRQAVARARRKFARAGVQQAHIWEMEAAAARR